MKLFINFFVIFGVQLEVQAANFFQEIIFDFIFKDDFVDTSREFIVLRFMLFKLFYEI